MDYPVLLIERFRGLRVTVIGDALLDTFVECVPHKLCSEGPVPVVWRGAEVSAPGGAANVAANLTALGASVTLAGITGRDPAGERLRAALAELGVRTDSLLGDAGCQTHHKTRILADGHYVVRVDEGDTRRCAPRLWPAIAPSLADADAIVLSDYGLGVLDERLIARLARQQPEVPVVVDAKRLSRFRRLRPTAVTPNLEEAVAVAGEGRPERLARRVRRVTGAGTVALTMGPEGAYLLDGPGSGRLLPARRRPVASTVGAGDSFVAALSLGLALGMPPAAATQVAVEAAGIVVAKPYTATVSAAELAEAMAAAPSQADRGRLAVVGG
jgi:D-beta-D-heptose 7-phosphate kinase/D-beta-D-heptose 1-phosphate adenosyltransferase